MWIEETKSGKYKAVERYTDYLTGKIKKASVTMDKNTAQSRKAAQAALNEKIEKALLKSPVLEATTLQRLVESYRSEQKLTLKPSTYRRNYYFANLLMDVFGKNTLIEKMSANYIRSTLIALDKTGEQKNEMLKRLKAVLAWGYKHDLMGNIAYLDKIERFPAQAHKAKIQDKFLESGEATLLLAAMKSPEWKSVTKFLVLSGLRFGELAALNKSDVDTRERIIKVSKTYDANNGVTTSAKTAGSMREVYMQDDLLSAAKEINLLMLQQKMLYGYSTSLFLANTNGGNANYYSYSKYLQGNAQRVLGRKITPHVLRHTHASLLMEQGVSIETISRRLGHSDSQITKEIYLHVTQKLKDKENEQLKELKII